MRPLRYTLCTVQIHRLGAYVYIHNVSICISPVPFLLENTNIQYKGLYWLNIRREFYVMVYFTAWRLFFGVILIKPTVRCVLNIESGVWKGEWVWPNPLPPPPRRKHSGGRKISRSKGSLKKKTEIKYGPPTAGVGDIWRPILGLYSWKEIENYRKGRQDEIFWSRFYLCIFSLRSPTYCHFFHIREKIFKLLLASVTRRQPDAASALSETVPSRHYGCRDSACTNEAELSLNS